MTTELRCPVCTGTELLDVVSVRDVPALCNAFAGSREEALAMPKGDLDLVGCPGCGMLHNAAFDRDLAPYKSDYENSLHFSPRFQAFATNLAVDLASRTASPGGTVVEIGSGGGDFLEMVAARGFERGYGVDPSLSEGARRSVGGATIEFVPGSLADLPDDVVADLVVCRHVLEHVLDPVGLLADALHRLSNSTTTIYVEVPDAGHMLRAPAVWDLVYEHAGYFTAPALTTALEKAGWTAVRAGTSFGGQYLWAEATAGSANVVPGKRAEQVAEMTSRLRAFGDAYRRTLDRWNDVLAEEHGSARRVAIWGAGSKGVSFVNAVTAPVHGVIDVNPRKRGLFVPGTGQVVAAPEDLAGAIDTVLVMNPLYLSEISSAAADAGFRASYIPVEA